jgi:putative phage-type endonuclease
MTSTAIADRAAWLDERRSGIGGSDIAGVAGISPWASPWSVWVSKVGLSPDDGPDDWTPSMRLGADLEPVIGAWFERETGLTVAGEQTLVRHLRMPHHFATVDGFVLDSPEDDYIGSALGVFEAKYTSQAWDALPEHYVAQVQWQLHVTGYTQAWVAALQFPYGRPRFSIFEVAADAERQAELVDVAETFWNDYVIPSLNGKVTPPPPDDHPKTAEAITSTWGHVDTAEVPTVALDDLVDVATELCDLKRDVAAKTKLIKFRETTLRDAFVRAGLDVDLPDGAALSEGTIDGRLAASWRAQSRTDVDAKAVRADHGDRYDRISTTRVLRLHGEYLP